MVRFFLKAFLLSLTAIGFSWFFEGAFYTFHYSRADAVTISGTIDLPRPAIVENLLKDTNFLLLGMAGKPYPAPYLTDTIIVGSFRANTGDITLTSVPRDLFVKVSGGSNFARINSLYEIGKSFAPLEPETFIKEKVEEISGLPIEYYAAIDVEGLEKVVDFFGGVDIEVKKPIADPFYPGPNYSYEPFYLETGTHHLGGHDAVRFARSRYAPRGDFERIARQQQLINVLKEKIGEKDISLEQSVELFRELDGHLFTNITIKDLPFLLTSLFTFQESEIQSFTLDIGPQGLLQESRSEIGAYILSPKAGLENYTEIQKFISEKLMKL